MASVSGVGIGFANTRPHDTHPLMKPACWSLPRDCQRRTSRCSIRVLPQAGHVCCSPAGLYKGFTRAAAPISHAARRARCRTGSHVRSTARVHVRNTARVHVRNTARVHVRNTARVHVCSTVRFHVRRTTRRPRCTPCPTCHHVRCIARRLRRTPCRAHFHARSAPRTRCDKFCLYFFIRCEIVSLAVADIGRRCPSVGLTTFPAVPVRRAVLLQAPSNALSRATI